MHQSNLKMWSAWKLSVRMNLVWKVSAKQNVHDSFQLVTKSASGFL